MTNFSSALREWSDAALALNSLSGFGFTRSRERVLSLERKEVWYIGLKFKINLAVDFSSGEVGFRFLTPDGGDDIPSPMSALIYFSSNSDELIQEIGACKSLADQALLLCKQFEINKWIYICGKWIDDHQFLDAIQKTDRWIASLDRMPIFLEYERYLSALNRDKKNFPCCT